MNTGQRLSHFQAILHSLSPMAAIYAALLPLARSLHEILDLEQYIDPLHKEKISSLHKKVDSIITFLEDYSGKYRGTADLVANGIKEAAYEAQDLMDSYLGSISRTNDDSSKANCGEMSLDQDLDMAVERIDFIWEEMMELKSSEIAEDLRSKAHSSPVDLSSTVQVTAKNTVVGFDGDLEAIKQRLYEDSVHLQIIPIIGMGGIGKTTLARKVYEESLLAKHVDVCGWVTVSAEYQRREILLRLLQSFKKVSTHQNEHSDESDAQLAKLAYQFLMGRRYFIVIDDIWSTKAWDDLKMIFPDDGSGSRILLTTRQTEVAVHAGSSCTPIHQMNVLNEDQSWKLLQKRIFGDESCPPELVEIGKKIARNCGGLPLTIVVVAGLLLASGNMMNEELWENISENISSRESTIDLQCSKILCLSYDRLPLRLKPCFLYIAAFPEDSQIDASKLIKLWLAEGFLKPNDHVRCLEDVGERYLEDLVNRSLILVSQKGPDGKVEIVGIHDMLREICITKAEEGGFLHHFSYQRDGIREFGENRYRRLRIHCTQNFDDWRISDSSIRSVILFSDRYYFKSTLVINCRHLSVLNALGITWPNFSYIISKFVNLRYIAFALNAISCPHGFPASISNFSNLQTVICNINDIGRDTYLVQVPYEIWTMPKLRHLIMDTPFHLLCPSSIGIVHESDLQTLETVINFKFTEEAVKILVNLKKLKVIFDFGSDYADDFNADYLFGLQKLEELEVFVFEVPDDPSMIWNHDFPISLRKLTLKGVLLPWKNMTIIGSLPNLEVLELMHINVFEISEWTPTEGQFLQLKYFHSSLDDVVKWEVEKEHFPSLESLVLEYATYIDEIPCGIGEIDSLQLIELRYCKESLVNSAMRIQEEQRANGNYAFQVHVIVF